MRTGVPLHGAGIWKCQVLEPLQLNLARPPPSHFWAVSINASQGWELRNSRHEFRISGDRSALSLFKETTWGEGFPFPSFKKVFFFFKIVCDSKKAFIQKVSILM